MRHAKSMSRRALLNGTALALGVSATCGRVPSAAAQEKVSKAEAMYQTRPKGQQRCGICLNFEPPNRCRFVEGEIASSGWCQFFAAKENAR